MGKVEFWPQPPQAFSSEYSALEMENPSGHLFLQLYSIPPVKQETLRHFQDLRTTVLLQGDTKGPQWAVNLFHTV